MSYKLFTKYFLICISTILFIVLVLNFAVDPYNKYNINLFNIEHKLTRDDRGFKIGQINNIEKIDNLIIGSSRSQTLDPQLLSKFFGGVSYNFGVGGGKIEDALGLVYYLEKEKKLPKNILLAVDFSGFNINSKPHSDFLNSKELNFLNNQSNSIEISHFLSIDTTRSTFKTLKMFFRQEKPLHYFDQNGLIQGPIKSIDIFKIESLSNQYFEIQYSNGQFNIDTQRVDYFKRFVQLCKKHNINLKIFLTPVFSYQLSLLQSHKELQTIHLKLLDSLSSIHPIYNFMQENKYTKNIDFFTDSIHYKKELGNIILSSIYLNNSNTDTIFVYHDKQN